MRLLEPALVFSLVSLLRSQVCEMLALGTHQPFTTARTGHSLYAGAESQSELDSDILLDELEVKKDLALLRSDDLLMRKDKKLVKGLEREIELDRKQSARYVFDLWSRTLPVHPSLTPYSFGTQ